MKNRILLEVISGNNKILDFIQHPSNEIKGEAYNVVSRTEISGRETLSFSIPLYILNEEGKQIENPKWKLLDSTDIKIRLVEEGKIQDFYVNTYTVSHNDGMEIGDYECISLAEYELGRIGYNINLDEKTLLKYAEEDAPENPDAVAIDTYEPDIHFWLNKILKNTDWNYEIESYYEEDKEITDNRQITEQPEHAGDPNYPHILFVGKQQFYEKDRVIAYDVDGKPIKKDFYDIKKRIIKINKNSIFNLVNEIAEKFEVYPTYKIEYSGPEIATKTIVFKNDSPEIADFNIRYGKNLRGITRTLDSSNLVTKMYVSPIENSNNDNGTVAIQNVEKNYAKENYLMNFDWFLGKANIDGIQSKEMLTKDMKWSHLDKTGTVVETLGAENIVKEYQDLMRWHNINIKDKQETINQLEEIITSLKDEYQYERSNYDAALTTRNQFLNELALVPDNDIQKEEFLYAYLKDNKWTLRFPVKGVVDTSISIRYESGEKITHVISKRDPIVSYVVSAIDLQNVDVNKAVKGVLRVKAYYTQKTKAFINDVLKYYEVIMANANTRANAIGKDLNEGGVGILATRQQMLKSQRAQILTIRGNKQNTIDSFNLLMAPYIKEGYWEDTSYNLYAKQEDTITNVIPNQELELVHGEPHWTAASDLQKDIFIIPNKKIFEKDGKTIFLYDIIDYKTIEVFWSKDEASSALANLQPYDYGSYSTAFCQARQILNGQIAETFSKGIYIWFPKDFSDARSPYLKGDNIWIRFKPLGCIDYFNNNTAYREFLKLPKLNRETPSMDATKNYMSTCYINNTYILNNTNVVLDSLVVKYNSWLYDAKKNDFNPYVYTLKYGANYTAEKDIIDKKVVVRIKNNMENSFAQLLTHQTENNSFYTLDYQTDQTEGYYYNDAEEKMKESAVPNIDYQINTMITEQEQKIYKTEAVRIDSGNNKYDHSNGELLSLSFKGNAEQETRTGYNINRNWENIKFSGSSPVGGVEKVGYVDDYRNALHFKQSIGWCKIVDDIPNYQNLIPKNSTITIEVVAKVTSQYMNAYYNSTTGYIPLNKKYKKLNNGWGIYYNTFTLKDNVAPSIHFSSGKGIYVSYFQIVLGDKPKEIEPYGISPSVEYPADIKVAEKISYNAEGNNLFNFTAEIPASWKNFARKENGFLVIDGKVPQSTHMILGKVKLQKNKHYSFYCNFINGSYANIDGLRFYLGRPTANLIAEKNGLCNVGFVLIAGDYSNHKIKIMITETGTIKEFEPYQSFTQEILLPNGEFLAKIGDISDELKEDGTIVKRIGKYEFSGEENFYRDRVTSKFMKFGFINASSTIGMKLGGEAKCNYFEYSKIDYRPVENKEYPECIITPNTEDYYSMFFIIKKEYIGEGTTNDFKNWLKDKKAEGNPVIVYYVLKTERTTKLIPTELKKYKSLKTTYGQGEIHIDKVLDEDIKFSYSSIDKHLSATPSRIINGSFQQSSGVIGQARFSGEAEQKVTKQGKNLLDDTTLKLGDLALSGFAPDTTTGEWYYTSNFTDVTKLINKDITFFQFINGKVNTFPSFIYFYKSKTELLTGRFSGPRVTIPSGAKYCRVMCNKEGNDLSRASVMFAEGNYNANNMLPYEPYIPNSPSPDYPSDINVVDKINYSVTGKNLINFEKEKWFAYSLNEKGAIVTYDGIYSTTSPYIQISKNNKISLQLKNILLEQIVIGRIRIVYYDKYKNFLSSTLFAYDVFLDSNKKYEITKSIAENVTFFRFSIWAVRGAKAIPVYNDFNSTFNDFQINVGEKIEYEPYNNFTQEILLPNGEFLAKIGDVSDELKEDGTIVKRIGKLELSGEENINYEYNEFFTIPTPEPIKQWGRCISNYFTTDSSLDEYLSYSNNNSVIWLVSKGSWYRTPEEFKNWAKEKKSKGKPATFYYPLNNERTTKLTTDELTKLQNLRLLQGEGSINVTSSNLQVPYEINYYKLEDGRKTTEETIKFKTLPKIGSRLIVVDDDLKIKNLVNIITGVVRNYNNPAENSITVANYRNKFKDLFQRISASVINVENNSAYYEKATETVDEKGQIKKDIIESTLLNNDLILSKSQNNDVVWGNEGIVLTDRRLNENGVFGQVRLTSGGIFVANEKDLNGNYIWKTGITPDYINADLLKTGAINTKEIKIFNDDYERFLWNSDGIHAYKELTNKEGVIGTDFGSFVRYNQDGLTFNRTDANGNSKTELELGWEGLKIGAQDGVYSLTSDDGVKIIDPTDNRTVVQMGTWTEKGRDLYGIRGLNKDGTINFALTQDGLDLKFDYKIQEELDKIKDITDSVVAPNLVKNSAMLKKTQTKDTTNIFFATFEEVK